MSTTKLFTKFTILQEFCLLEHISVLLLKVFNGTPVLGLKITLIVVKVKLGRIVESITHMRSCKSNNGAHKNYF